MARSTSTVPVTAVVGSGSARRLVRAHWKVMQEREQRARETADALSTLGASEMARQPLRDLAAAFPWLHQPAGPGTGPSSSGSVASLHAGPKRSHGAFMEDEDGMGTEEDDLSENVQLPKRARLDSAVCFLCTDVWFNVASAYNKIQLHCFASLNPATYGATHWNCSGI